MHPLINRQLRKYLPDHLKESPDIQAFLNAVDNSYIDFDEKLSMIQRATSISSEELYLANAKLTKEAERQQQILASLEQAMNSLNSNLDGGDKLKHGETKNFDAEKLARHLSNLAQEVSEITAEKNVLLKSLEVKNESLSNYVQMVSHDLKSPVRNVNALMSWILEEEKSRMSEDSKNNCLLISENLTKMDNLINGILKHASIGAQMEEKKNIDIKMLLGEIKKNSNIPDNVDLQWSDNLPTICLERIWIEQLFTILLTNAIAATEHLSEGLIKIKSEDDDQFWKFSISDNGKGIPERHHKSIFEMFRKLENNPTSAGVGLALAKKIIALYKGHIWLESEENKGTTFYFTLKKNCDGQA
ncbi:HAMP domain-containing sensor histidine kinase [uncultured Kriegella sp.]|uniref:sensor histidine kinase n=1 Tax=uncultured Kriegella sp. TaxID=1798910 RepID=UPI0030DCDC70|tara:strand:+ start:87985 stop:89061 length:1077 start_codon:yes stop_codon:yes gene_type:complete